MKLLVVVETLNGIFIAWSMASTFTAPEPMPSNFMIGVTAAASAGLYLNRGYISPGIAMPVMLGVLAGSLIGARMLVKAKVKVLRYVFAAVIVVLGFEMIFNGATGRL